VDALPQGPTRLSPIGLHSCFALCDLELRVQVFRVEGLGFRVWGRGLGVWGSLGVGIRRLGFGFGV